MAQPATQVSPFHAGEQAVQERLGVRSIIEPWARKVVRSWMPDEHREFYAQLPFVVAAARDDRGRPWVTLLPGTPGFIRSPDPTSLVIAADVLPGDALEHALDAGTEFGLLGIELDTRRRNRVNGVVKDTSDGQLRFEVSQAFGNCPQYITERRWYSIDFSKRAPSSVRCDALSQSMQAWISTADTFFVGSGYSGDLKSNATGMDASHRGGPKGFVTVESPTRLVFPDYAGNNHFNTIGNLVLDPRVGMLFVDFASGALLQISGRASIDWDSSALNDHPGARRLVCVDIEAIVELSNVLPLRFEDVQTARELELVKREQESADVASFYFQAPDGAVLADFEAGQHLPIELSLPDQGEPVQRTYSLSNGPGDTHYRISVKREPNGLASRFLHDQLRVGSRISARSPAGDFVLGYHDKPVVLLSAGIGVTPMISMLHELTETPSQRSIVFLHSARDGRHHSLAQEVKTLADTHENVTLRIGYSRPLPEDVLSRDFDFAGRIDASEILRSVPNLDAMFYLCGPTPFLADMTDLLVGLGVSDDKIHEEQF